jgi:diguanylate cyclase (GGDEF)-like protein/PAS domain S-box-containing protein
MVTDFPIQGILDQLVLRIVDVLPITAAGVTLISPGAVPRYVAASSDAALRFERFQTDLDEGPCVLAYQTGTAVAVPNLLEEDRFPQFGPRAFAEGLAAVFTFPLRNGGAQMGALDLYRDTPGSLDAGTMEAAQTLADVAAAYLLNAQARVDLQESSDRSRVSETRHRRLAAQLAAAQHLAGVGSWEWDIDADSLSWSDELCRIFGIEPGEAPPTYSGYLNAFHPVDRDRADRAIKRAIAKGESFAFDHRVQLPDGSERVVRTRGDVTAGQGGVADVIGTSQDVTDLETADILRELAVFALRDELTGLHNRRGFVTLADHLIEVAGCVGGSVALLFIDVDGMKSINDTHGHGDGDRALVEVARFLLRTIRSSDVVARVGGDEFCILMLGTGTETDSAVDRVVGALRLGPPSTERSCRPSLSVGVAWMKAGSGTSLDELMSRADRAMYEDKRSRRRRARVLIIDDEANLRLLAALSLGGNYEVTTAATGGAGLAAMMEQLPDLLLLDLGLPDMHGSEVLRRLRAGPGGDRVSVIVVTGATGGTDEFRSLEQGVDDFIVKPFDFDVLEARMRNVLGRSLSPRA